MIDKKKVFERIRSEKLDPGKHDPDFFKGEPASPMLVSEIPGHRGRIASQDYVFVQPKLDGWCCMANTVARKIYTRSGREITTLPHINAALPSTGPEWLHGELWKPGADCDDVQRMVKRGDTSLEFHVFDCVSLEGFEVRNERLLKIPTSKIIHIVPSMRLEPHEIAGFYGLLLNRGYEGQIIRLDGHGYYHGRSQNVFKMKPGTEGM